MKALHDLLTANEAMMYCALRFDGYRYLEQAHLSRRIPRKTGFPDLIDAIIDKGRLHANDDLNFCAFFALQRALGKWGNEQDPATAPTRLTYYRLFVHLKDTPTPEGYDSESPEWSEGWKKTRPEKIEEAVVATKQLCRELKIPVEYPDERLPHP